MPAIKALLTTGVAYLRSLGAGGGTDSYVPGGMLDFNTTQTATIADTNLTTLATYTLPANTLDVNGKGVRIKAWGQTGANANTKNFFLTLGGDTLHSRSSSGNAVGWFIETVFIRTGAGTYKGHGRSSFGTSPSVAVPFDMSEDFTTDLAITLKGLNGTASAGDCVFDGWTIEMLP